MHKHKIYFRFKQVLYSKNLNFRCFLASRRVASVKMSTFTLRMIPALTADNVKIKDVALVEKKINQLIKEGREKLQIISDFDRTLSRHNYHGQTTKSSYCVFESIPDLPKGFVEQTQALYNKFRKIEDDPNLTVADKLPHMIQWWEQNDKLYVGLDFSLEKIEQAVVSSEVMLRDGVEICLKRLRDASVPLLVFSAGLGDVVQAILKHYKVDYENQHVISNFFNVDDKGKILGFKGNTIHVYNKNQHAIENTDYFKELAHRENVILMGDSEGDANMDEGVQGSGAVLKIGFLNVNFEAFLPKYQEVFDIVLIDDPTVNVFSAILDLILKDSK